MFLCKIRKPILWVAIPSAVDVADRLGAKLLLYQVSDKYDANEDSALSHDIIRKMDQQLKNRAGVVMYSGRKLFEEADVPHRYFLEQAVDFDHWSRVGSGELEIAPEVANIPPPRLGYFGAIEPWLVDQNLIRRASHERPDWNWIFIGNKSRGLEIEKLPNVYFLPAVSYDRLPNYAAGFDVCVLPWDTELAFTSYGSAIKVREYLATSKPVVISPLPEYETMSDVLRIARSSDEFLHLIDEALHEQGSELSSARQDAVRKGTWDARAEWVSNLIEETLSKKGKG